MPSIRILIAEDHPMTIAGLNMLVDTQPGWQACGQVADGAGVMAAVADAAPDVLLLDLALPKRTGLDLLQDLQRTANAPRTVADASPWFCTRRTRRRSTIRPGTPSGSRGPRARR